MYLRTCDFESLCLGARVARAGLLRPFPRPRARCLLPPAPSCRLLSASGSCCRCSRAETCTWLCGRGGKSMTVDVKEMLMQRYREKRVIHSPVVAVPTKQKKWKRNKEAEVPSPRCIWSPRLIVAIASLRAATTGMSCRLVSGMSPSCSTGGGNNTDAGNVRSSCTSFAYDFRSDG